MFDYLLQMPSDVLVGLLLAILILLVAVLIVLQLFHHSSVSSIANPIYEHIVKKAQKRSEEIIANAMDKARELKVQGEMKGIKAVARDKVESKKILSEYEQALDEIASQTRQYVQERGHEAALTYERLSSTLEAEIQEDTETLREKIKENQKKLVSSLESIETLCQETERVGEQTKNSLHSINESYINKLQEEFQEKFENAFVSFDRQMQSMYEQIEVNATEHINKSLKDAEAEIKEYKKAREEIIDKDLQRVVEYVTAEVLKKDLSVDDHVELARRSLEEAVDQEVFNDNEK